MQLASEHPACGRASAEGEAFVPRSGAQGLRRRTGAAPLDYSSPRSGRAGDGKRTTFREDVGHAAAETYLVTGLAFTLLGYLGVSYRWISQLIALLVYAVLLMPGFIKVGYYYFFSRHVIRSVIYGEQPRNRLDLYIPKDNSKSSPVVAFVTGGAWIIGYKAWGALLGRRLAERGIIVACIDYRNFPQGTISDMVSDASEAISFICNNVVSFGGDPNKIYLMGQSAGAHIAACALLEQAIKESKGENTYWNVAQIKAYFGLSGGYNIQNLVDHFHERGLYRSIFLSIMEGEESLPHYSPEIVAKKLSAETISLLPQIVLLHGTADYSIPSSASETFADVLKQAGGKVELQLYKGKTHTDVFLQDPLRGGRDKLVEDVLSVIHVDDASARERDASAPTPERLVYEWQIKLARQISPF
ncbi:probable isoprenylcysteine alpha-carbonyl methylesterase ICME [Zea mays]|uniref:protein-S-isoprenylcysteine alpha-carbonyl methylesterase n=1 Tax=Zea mays TaxID=4577 RepID=A0A1D6FL00_MAIZE|nr:probable isoprenylcysteine alpha-carbonyl methylesterase ICME [Zea mays]AQK92374.1 putative isoprenylcysteine alpha-carbonyl methylesterase ICMEL2 [Zea mays]|eukprot:XP_008656061.1 probable isoprenylcysteine alpha-carbonyl methylesterase ICME [Zea mays]